jgi:hypothetical protein
VARIPVSPTLYELFGVSFDTSGFVNPFRSSPAPAYAVHKWALALGAGFWLVGIIATKLVLVAAGGVAFITSGVAAMVGGRSLANSITVGGGEREWSEQELAEMGPAARLEHALLTGAVLILLGVVGVGFVGLWLRNDWVRGRRAELEKARGASVWQPQMEPATLTFGARGWYEALAIGGDRICYSTSGIAIVSAEMHCTAAPKSLWLGDHPVRRVQFSGAQLLWASEDRVGVIKVSTSLSLLDQWRARGLPRALAGAERWVFWDEGGAIVAAELDVKQTRRFDVGLASEGRIVLAGLGERLLFGPTADCPLKAMDLAGERQECLMPTAKRPVAIAAAAAQVVVAFEDGELFSISGSDSKRWGKVSSPLAISLVESTLFVVTKDGVYRFRRPGATPEPLFAHSLDECEAAGAFGDLLAWQFGTEVRVIRRDAQPLEPFELPTAP